MIGVVRTLEQVRKDLQVTRQYVADICGVSGTLVWRWEKGKSEPNPDLYPLLAKAYGLSLQELERVLNPQPNRRVVLWEDREWNLAQDRIRR